MDHKRINIKFRILAIVVSVAIFGFAHAAFAGFGISPPFIKNQQLVPGSKYDQTITLLRSSADEDLRAEVKVNAPQIASWITIDKGNDFILPKGEYQVPMVITINVPKDAELGNYKGNINIKITSAGRDAKQGVAIALGARVDVDLTLTNVSYADFLVRVAAIPDFELLSPPWSWRIFSYFLSRVRVVMNIENIGNVKTAPSKVTLEIYDLSKNKLLESGEDDAIKQIEPFSTRETVASFPTRLADGQYWGKVKVYKGLSITNVYEIAFTIAKPGGLPKGTASLGVYPWLLLGGYLLLVAVLLYSIIRFRLWRFSGRALVTLILLIVSPLKPLLRSLGSGLNSMKANFWKWLANKVSKYDDKGGGRQ